jgi:tetratricopeptide (TPR) repeat protein
MDKNKIYAAIAILAEWINKNPEFIPARLTLGRLYVECDMLSEAKKEYSEVIKQSPDDTFACKGLDEVNKRLEIITEKKEAVVNRLNKFLEEIKIRFAYSPSLAASPSYKDKGAVVGRLNRFLNVIKTHFAPSSGISF